MATNTTICAGCGATVATGEKFCPRCQQATMQMQEARRQERKRREMQILFAIFVVMVALGYYFLR